jgi:hypothetical protein
MVYVPQCSVSLMKLRRHLPRRIQNSLSKRRILPCKVNQQCTLHLGINLSRLQCCNHAQRLQKAKIDDDVEDVNSVNTETLHPNTQPIGEAKLINFQFLRARIIIIILILHLLQLRLMELSNRFIVPQTCSSTFALVMPQLRTLHKLPYIKSSHDSLAVSCVQSK